MKKRTSLLSLMAFGILHFVSFAALATPNMNTIFVQGYLRKSTGTAVSDGSYTMVFSIRSGATYFWTQTIAVNVSSGFFSQNLSGASSAPYAGNIDSTSVAAAAAGAMAVNVQTTVDGQAVSFDVQSTPVPLSLLSDKAISVIASGVDSTALAANSVTATKIASGVVAASHLAASGTMPAWNGSALTNINASNISSGTLPGTSFPATLPAANGSNLTSLNASNLSSGTLPTAVFPATLPAMSGVNLTSLNASNLSSGTLPTAVFPATLPAMSGVNLTNLNASNIASGTLSASLLPATFSTATTFSAAGTALAVTNNATVGGTLGVTGATTLAATTLSGTLTLPNAASVTSAGTTGTAINMTVSGVGGGITLGSNSGGVNINTTVNQPTSIGGGTTTGTISIGASSGTQAVNIGTGTGAGQVIVGNTGGAANTRLQGGTGKILIQSNSITGGTFSAMGTCAIASFSCAAGANTARTCTGVPSSSAVVFCSPVSGAGTNNPTWGIFATAANTVTINSSASCSVASIWNCTWIVL